VNPQISPRAKWCLVIACAVALILVLMVSRSRSTRPVAAYFGDPVPDSVRVVGYQSNDWFGVHPEPVAFLRFTGSKNDIDDMITRAGFEMGRSWNGPSPGGPEWWESPHKLGWKAKFYSRKHPPSEGGNGWEVGQNRYWDEILAVDETGTNVFVLIWGI